jgi:protein SCO1/2
MKMNPARLSSRLSKMAVVAGLALGAGLLHAQTNAAPVIRCACCLQGKPARSFTDQSIYQLTSDWTTDTGETMKLGRLRGKSQVVAMFFTSCPGACPILVRQMQALADSLPANVRTNVGFLLVSFDSAHDRPAVLHAYRAVRQLPEGQWTLLRGRPDDAQELALVLGVKYKQTADGRFVHSNLVTVLNAEGEIAFQQPGLDNARDELARQLAALVAP